MLLGYNTNGLAHQDLVDAVELLAEIGYRGVAITIDHGVLAPDNPPVGGDSCRRWRGENSEFGDRSRLLQSPRQIEPLRRLLAKHGMRSVIETGARFLLDARIKHEPTLLSEDRRRRIEFYKYAIDCAAGLGSDCVSLWSGVLHGSVREGDGGGLAETASRQETASRETSSVPVGRGEPLTHEQAMDRLVDGLREVLDYAAKRNVLIGFEPEPGMFVDTMRAFEDLLHRIDAPNLRLTLDIGHLHCQGETPIADVIGRWAPRLVNVHIEDMRRGKHEHLMFGEGEIDFPPILHALAQVGYTGGVYVELSRHSHEGPTAARKAFEFLQPNYEG
jgi:L-ribulose-5-phosphate 3-epimerase